MKYNSTQKKLRQNVTWEWPREWETEQRRMRDRAMAASDGVKDRAAVSERQSSGAAERVKDRLAERVKEQSSWERAWERKKERKRAVRELGSARVLELGFNKITILPLKMSKLTKQGLFMFLSGIQIPAGIVGICQYGRYSRYLPVRPVFLPIRNIGVNRTGLPAGTVYSSRTGQYGTELTTLV